MSRRDAQSFVPVHDLAFVDDQDLYDDNALSLPHVSILSVSRFAIAIIKKPRFSFG
jgi:hypothetical protein